MPNVIPDFYKLSAIKEHFEGYSGVAYKDSGNVWTVGFGSTYNHDKKRKVQEGDIVTKEIAIRWMATDVDSVIRQANQYITTQLSPSQSAAIVDMIYNRGIGNFLKTNLDELINGNPFDPLIKHEMINTGLKDKLGNLLWGLGRRRRSEWILYSTGQLKFDFPRWGDI
jgi:lysozyme